MSFDTDDKTNHEDLGVTEENAQMVVKLLKNNSSPLTVDGQGSSKQLSSESAIPSASASGPAPR